MFCRQRDAGSRSGMTNERGLCGWHRVVMLMIMIVVILMPYFVFSNHALAVDPIAGLDDVATKGGYKKLDTNTGPTAFAVILGTVVQVFLSLLGIIFIILMLYAGYEWMTAGGDQTKVDKAQKTIWRAIIGLIVLLGSYAIWIFIFTSDLV